MSVWSEYVENEFVKNINDTYTLNLAISILRDRENFREEINRLKENKLTPDELVDLLNQELVRQNKDYKEKFDKIIECLGINEEILETCGIYDINGIEIYKILQGVDK